MKTCTRCEIEFPATTEYFHRNKYGKNGLAARCKHCMNEYRNIEYRKKYGEKGNFDIEIKITDFGVGNRELDIKLVKGQEYQVPLIYGRYGKDKRTFTGKLIQETEDLVILQHKKGFCECFRKMDFLTGEYEIKEA